MAHSPTLRPAVRELVRMYFRDLLSALFRRWWLVVGGLAVTGALAVAATTLVPAKHEITASVVLLPPRAGLQSGGNPYLALGGLQTASDVLARALLDDQVAEQFRRDGLDGTYVTETDRTTGAPVILVTVDARSQQMAERTLQAVLDQLPRTLSQLQGQVQVRDDARITSSLVTRDDVPKVVRKSQTRASIAAVALGLAVTLFGTAALDNLLSGGLGGSPLRRDEPGPRLPAPREEPDEQEVRQDSRLDSRGDSRHVVAELVPDLEEPPPARELPRVASHARAVRGRRG